MMIDIDQVFADDRLNDPAARSLPWEETRDGVTVVVEPKPHWAADMRAWRHASRDYCRYADWTENGPAARFFRHAITTGDDVMKKARACVAHEMADGLWR